MNAVFHQRGSALALLVLMMMHVHGVPGAPIRIGLLLSAVWHAAASLHIVLGDYPIPRSARQVISATVVLGAVVLCFVSSAAIVRAYQAPAPLEVEEGDVVAPAVAWEQADPILARCRACHPATTGSPEDFRAWGATAPVREQVESGHNLTPAESALLLQWVDAGMPGPSVP